MVRTIITPENQDVSIHIPENYIGKQIEVLLYAVDELNEPALEYKKPADYRGKLNLSTEEYNDMQVHLKNIREEWNRDI